MITYKSVCRKGVELGVRLSKTSIHQALLVMVFLALLLSSCATAPKANTNRKWVIGFSQFGHASQWRVAQTISIQNAFNNDSIFALILSDAQESQENQINVLRSFIARKVDILLVTPLGERGYGPVLREAGQAGIPVIMIDHDVAREDRSLRLATIGSDFTKEGEKAGLWLAGYLKNRGIDDGLNPIRIVEVQGTAGYDVTTERGTGFRNILKAHANWHISQSGDFTSSSGKAVMEAFLKADKNIQVLYAHNDQMALGAIEAIKEVGLEPGKDIIVVSEDAVKGVFEAIIAGSLNASIECSPMVGPQALQAAKDLRDGKKIPSRIWTIEGVFDSKNAADELESRQY